MVLRLFSSKKTPKDIVLHAKEQLLMLYSQCLASPNAINTTSSLASTSSNPTITSSSQTKGIVNQEEYVKVIDSLKQLLCGEKPEFKVEPSEVAKEIHSCDLLIILTQVLPYLEFETRKTVREIFKVMLKVYSAGRYTTVEYLSQKPETMINLLQGYEHNQEVALLCSEMLRMCLKYDALTRIFLQHENFWKLFIFCNTNNFGIASDAFTTLKDILTKHKQIASEFMDKNYDRFLREYLVLLKSKEYIAKRQSLKIMSEILLEKSNFSIMKRFIADGENLKVVMNLLVDKRKNIQIEAFHVFKVFVANPNKAPVIREILLTNKQGLVQFLSDFHKERDEQDGQFKEEKQLLVTEINKLN